MLTIKEVQSTSQKTWAFPIGGAGSSTVVVVWPDNQFFLEVICGARPTKKLAAAAVTTNGSELDKGYFIVQLNMQGTGFEVSVNGFQKNPYTASVSQIADVVGSLLYAQLSQIRSAYESAVESAGMVEKAKRSLMDAQRFFEERVTKQQERLNALAVWGFDIK